MDFRDFIAPFDADEFRRDVLGKRPLHIQGGVRAPLLTWERFNQALAIAPLWNEETLKVFYDNRSALRDNYCDAPTAPGELAPVNPGKVRALIGHGASLIANHMHRVSPEIGAAARMLEETFAARAGANVYCSFKDVRAFQTHFDLHDVFAVQTEGEKIWNVYEARADAPVRPVPPGDEAEKWLIATRGKVLFQARMKPGDILYLPRGQYHDAITEAAHSMHVSLWIKPSRGLSLFELMESAAERESIFRADLPDARDEAALRDRLERLGEVLNAILRQPAFAAEVRNMQRGLASAAPLYDLPAQSKPTVYNVLRPVTLARRSEGVFAAFPGGEIALGGTYPAIEWAMQQRFFSVEDALARFGAVRADELRPVLAKMAGAGVIAETALAR